LTTVDGSIEGTAMDPMAPGLASRLAGPALMGLAVMGVIGVFLFKFYRTTVGIIMKTILQYSIDVCYYF